MTRCPRGARPERGVIARFVPLSSTKTNVVGSWVWMAVHHAARAVSSRSAANRTFFERDGKATDGARHGRNTHGNAVLLRPEDAVLRQRGIGMRGDLCPQAVGLIRSD